MEKNEQQMDDFESKYGFAAQLAALTDDQLINRFNREVGNSGWGNARAEFLACLRAEIEARSFDSSLITSESSFQLSRRVELAGDKLRFADST